MAIAPEDCPQSVLEEQVTITSDSRDKLGTSIQEELFRHLLSSTSSSTRITDLSHSQAVVIEPTDTKNLYEERGQRKLPRLIPIAI